MEKAREMAGVAGAAYAANHGLQLSVGRPRSRRPSRQPYVSAAREVLEAVARSRCAGRDRRGQGPGRGVPLPQCAVDEAAAGAAILAAIGRPPRRQRFVVQEGRKVIELRPPLEINKGTAVAHLPSVWASLA